MNHLKKFIFSKKWMLVLSVVFATLLCILSVGTQLAVSKSVLINKVLKVETSKNTGTSDDPDTQYYPSEFSSQEELQIYGKEVCKEAEAEGLVLMKNENGALPLTAGDDISLFFNSSVSLYYGTTGSSAANTSTYKNLKTAFSEVDLNVNNELWNLYSSEDFQKKFAPTKKYDRDYKMQIYKTNAASWSDLSSATASLSSYGDAAIAVVGRASGEGMDVSAKYSDGWDGSYLSLTEAEKDVLKHLTTLKKAGTIKKIVVLLNTAQTFCTDFLTDTADIQVDACMWIGNLGVTGVEAVADALVGKVVPSGKLSDTYVNDLFSSPAMASWIMNENGKFGQSYTDASAVGLNSTQQYYGAYVEGIYVGYRYYETRYEDKVLGTANVGEYDYNKIVSRSFGYGLSYTQFEYSNFSAVEREDGDYDVSVTVTNTGTTYSGKEVVEVYLQKPYTGTQGVETASIELAGFAKTDALAPGANQTVTVTVEKNEFKTYDSEVKKTYILEAGKYYLAVGSSAHDALNNVLALKDKTIADGMDYNGNADFAAMVWDNPTIDATTYSKSQETKNAITNRLDFCDMNKYEGKGGNSVTYVSRGDWAGTFPKTSVSFSANNSTMLNDLSSYKDIEEDADAVAHTYGADNGYKLAMLRSTQEKIISYNDESWEKLLDQMTFEEQALMVTNGAFQTEVISSVVKPGTKEQDGPTGVSGSINSLSFPSEGIWASTFNVEIIAKVGNALAEDARANGQHGMYLPGINLHRTPFGGRAHEYFSEDPYLTGISCMAEIKAVQAKGVISHVKHFVFNDEEDQRNGICIWLNEQSAREIYLKPWEYAVNPSRGNAHAVMSSFNRAGNLWVSASSALMETILRDEFGFDGYVITDMASSNGALYMTFVDGFMNGTDLYLGTGSETALNEYASSLTFKEKIRESAHRILYILANYSCAMNGYSVDTDVIKVIPWWNIVLNVMIATFAVLTVASVGCLIYANIRNED